MQGQRWIVVAESPFLPANGGGERENAGFVRAAVRAGAVAVLIVPGLEESEILSYQAELGDVPIIATPRRTSPLMLLHPTRPFVVASRPAPSWLLPRVRALAPDATGIVAFSYKVSGIGEALARGLRLPAVVRQHNREGAYHRSLAAGTSGPRGLVLAWEAMRIERDEPRLGRRRWLTGTADISLSDAEWRRGTGARNVVHVPPFALDLGGSPEPAAGEGPPVNGAPRVLFLGALDISTNTDALGWFLDEVWPAVLAGHPTAQFDVVGRGPSQALRDRLAAVPRVRLAADVPDVRPYLRGASVAINPAISGSGVNIKLIEYMDAAIPLVSTSLATRGLPLTPGEHLEIQDDPKGFADAVLRLLEDPAAARETALRGQRRVRELLDAETNLGRIAALLGGPAR